MKSFLILLSLFLLGGQSAYAKVVARVIEAKGNSFVFMGKDVKTLSYGSKIEDLSEIMVEDSSALSIVNNAGQVFHIRGGSLVKMYEGLLELKNGNIWGVSELTSPYMVTTPNSVTRYDKGEFILSFDNISGKSQLLVLVGKMKYSNALDPNLNTNVESGHFSLVDQNYENGLPRTPTKVGLKSFKKTKQLFSEFKNLDKSRIEKMLWGGKKDQTSSRSIASVSESSEVKRTSPGKIITIRTLKKSASRGVASVSPMHYYNEVKKEEKIKKMPVKTNKTAPIRYFGLENKKNKAETSQVKVMEKSRVPASVGKSALIKELKSPSEFESSLSKEIKENGRHTPAVNELIDELKSYKNDYQKEY